LQKEFVWEDSKHTLTAAHSGTSGALQNILAFEGAIAKPGSAVAIIFVHECEHHLAHKSAAFDAICEMVLSFFMQERRKVDTTDDVQKRYMTEKKREGNLRLLKLDLYSLKLDKYTLGEDLYSLKLDKYSLMVDAYTLGTDKFTLGTDKYTLGTDLYSLCLSKYDLRFYDTVLTNTAAPLSATGASGGGEEEQPNTYAQLVARTSESQDAMQVRPVIDRLVDQVVREAPPWRPNRSPLPAKGATIEVQWTAKDENYLKWFTAGAVKPNVTQTRRRRPGKKSASSGGRSATKSGTPNH
jgi:hypothetical protein